MKPRFLLDEHINRAVQRQLRRNQPDTEVLAVGDPGAPALAFFFDMIPSSCFSF